MSKKIVQKYNQLFDSNITYLSDKQVLQLVEELKLKETFPYEKFDWGKKLSDQPKEIQSFFDAHVTDIELTPEQVLPSLVQRAFKAHIKGKVFSWRDITLNDIYTVLSVTGAEDARWLFSQWSKESILLHKQSEEMHKQVQEHLEKLDLGDSHDEPESNSNNQSDTAA